MSDVMQERYGTASPRRRVLLIVVSSVLGVIFISWLAWAAWFHSSPPLEAEVTRFDIVSTHEAKVQIAATVRDEDSKETCLVRATARDHTIVGELNLTAADLLAKQGTWLSLRTERRATAVELVRCTG